MSLFEDSCPTVQQMKANLWTGMYPNPAHVTKKIKFFINGVFSKCDQICSFLQIWSPLLKKSLMENFIFCAVDSQSVLQNMLPDWLLVYKSTVGVI